MSTRQAARPDRPTAGRPGYRVAPFPRSQHQSIDWLGLMHRQHTVHGLLEVDVTRARVAIRERRARTGEGLSFTAFVVDCFARAVAADPRMHAYRRGRSQLVLFDDVDVTVLVESDVEGEKIPIPHIVRAANRKVVEEIHREIRAAQGGPVPYQGFGRLMSLWLLVPGFVREFVWARVLADPVRRRRLTGTVGVTAVGMFGRGVGWAVPLTSYSILLTLGGIARKPWVRSGHATGDERIEVREILALTLSIDHDVINGAPLARFAMRLRELLEAGPDPEAGPATTRTEVLGS